MALAKRNDIDDADRFARTGAAEHRYDTGTPVGRLQAELSHRLTGESLAQGPVLFVSPTERIVQFVSVAGGYAALLAGYAAITIAILRWI